MELMFYKLYLYISVWTKTENKCFLMNITMKQPMLWFLTQPMLWFLTPQFAPCPDFALKRSQFAPAHGFLHSLQFILGGKVLMCFAPPPGPGMAIRIHKLNKKLAARACLSKDFSASFCFYCIWCRIGCRWTCQSCICTFSFLTKTENRPFMNIPMVQLILTFDVYRLL